VVGEYKRLYETEPYFIPLQYPLLFPRGEDGFSTNIPIRSVDHGNQKRTRITVTMREWIAYRMQNRVVEYGNVVNSRRLLQQFSVDCHTMIESQRLRYIRKNQKTIRCGILNGLHEAMDRGETDASNVGRKIVLPPSFTGGRRYMFNNCQDAMAICKKYGYPDLFVTITCNSNLREIQDFLKERNLKASDRPDIVCRMFKMKLDKLMDDFKKEELFGKVDAGIHCNISSIFFSFSSTENMSNEISIISISFIKENKTMFFLAFLKKRPCYPSKKTNTVFFKVHFFLCYFLKHSVIFYLSRGTSLMALFILDIFMTISQVKKFTLGIVSINSTKTGYHFECT
jgi:hypothetical protein